MKKILGILLLLAFSLCVFCGCSEISQTIDASMEEAKAERAVIADMTGSHLEKVAIDADSGFTYYRDLRTDVMYSVYVDTYKAGYAGGMGCGLTVMYHPDGSPLLYSDWLSFCVTPDTPVVLEGVEK